MQRSWTRTKRGSCRSRAINRFLRRKGEGMSRDEQWVQRMLGRQVSRRGVMAGAAAAAFLAACSKKISTGNEGNSGSSVPDELESELSIYNWADYVHPKTYPAFEKEFDIKI